jgi:hypothetical protein
MRSLHTMAGALSGQLPAATTVRTVHGRNCQGMFTTAHGVTLKSLNAGERPQGVRARRRAVRDSGRADAALRFPMALHPDDRKDRQTRLNSMIAEFQEGRRRRLAPASGGPVDPHTQAEGGRGICQPPSQFPGVLPGRGVRVCRFDRDSEASRRLVAPMNEPSTPRIQPIAKPPACPKCHTGANVAIEGEAGARQTWTCAACGVRWDVRLTPRTER